MVISNIADLPCEGQVGVVVLHKVVGNPTQAVQGSICLSSCFVTLQEKPTSLLLGVAEEVVRVNPMGYSQYMLGNGTGAQRWSVGKAKPASRRRPGVSKVEHKGAGTYIPELDQAPRQQRRRECSREVELQEICSSTSSLCGHECDADVQCCICFLNNSFVGWWYKRCYCPACGHSMHTLCLQGHTAFKVSM